MNDNIVTFRPATIADAQLLLDWRNDAVTRRNSRNSGLVGLQEHQAWLARILASPDYIVQIAESGDNPVGVVRADRMAQGWELSWTVAPQARGQGLGSGMLKTFAASLDGCLTAVIRKDNRASATIAARAGLTLKGDAAPDADFEVWTRE